MKKIILTFLILLNFCALADVMPYYINSLRRNGIGFTRIQSPVIMRRDASDDGEILETLNFDYKNNATCLINNSRCTIDEIFATYSQNKKLAFLTTLDVTQNDKDESWSLVCFNQTTTPVCGWVKEKDTINKTENRYYNWSEFFSIYGKKYGLFLFKDLQKNDKILYSAPHKNTNSVGSIEMPYSITPWLVRGNWILVKVNDFGHKQKTGWINFRDNKGKLKLFVKFD